MKTGNYTQVSVLSLTVCLLFFISACAQKNKTVSIGSKQFVVTTMEAGKPETGAMEQMIFSDSMFDNLQCHEWGFTAGKYTATQSGENYNFEATMQSPNEGAMIWKGMVMGDYVHGEMVWKKSGQQDLHYTFEGKAGTIPEKKEISLDGKKYFTNTMVHGKPETAYDEDWTFDAGTLRSPSCEMYGFFKSPYKAWEQNGIITMESLFQSEKEGHMNFTATIKNDHLTGNVLWHKDGQDDVLYDVTGDLKK